jgi:competence protein ComEC
MIQENAGVEGDSQALQDWPNADCNADACLVTLRKDGRDWQILATRSSHYISALALSAACRRADIVVSERWLPASCQPRWLKADRNLLSQVGGMTINLENQNISTALDWTGKHPWTRYRSGETRADNPSKPN